MAPDRKLVSIPCPVCDAGAFKVLFPDRLGANSPVFGYKWTPEIRKTYRIVRCDACGHVYCSPRLADMYEDYKEVIDEGYLLNEDLRVRTARNVIGTIRKFAPGGLLLDVGCSTGDFLHAARDSHEVEGLELSAWASQFAAKRGLKIHVKKLEEMKGADGAYDVITLWGVIEHLEWPKREMRHVNRLLKKGGIACFWTGDSDSFWARLLGRHWWYLMGQHIHYFNWRSMDRLLADAGFERVHKGVYPYVISFAYLGIGLSRYPGIGSVARFLFRILGLGKKSFVLMKSDEMFGIYRKVRDL